MPDPRLSVVIPTYNRRDRLARVLAALERQAVGMGEFEVVVVNDGSTDGTADWLASASTSYRLSAINVANGGPARARNAGIEAAHAPIVLFLDDDVEPTPQLIPEHLKSHAAEPDVVVIGPLASLPHYGQPWVAWEQAKVEAQYAAMARGDWPPSFRQFWTGNASVPRHHLLAAGGFDTSYLRAEDVELGMRLRDRGLSFRFNPAARGLHHAERSLASWEGVQSSYGRLEVAIFGRLGDTALLQLLSDNWWRLNPATRWLVRGCLSSPKRHSTVHALLRAQIELAQRTRVPLLTDKACSLLANLLYWRASAEALGAERAARVFTRRAPSSD
jgi:glycosyltransferase involved in cell wall biosynthesis